MIGPADGIVPIVVLAVWADALVDAKLSVVAAKRTANAASLRRFMGKSPLESGVRSQRRLPVGQPILLHLLDLLRMRKAAHTLLVTYLGCKTLKERALREIRPGGIRHVAYTQQNSERFLTYSHYWFACPAAHLSASDRKSLAYSVVIRGNARRRNAARNAFVAHRQCLTEMRVENGIR